MRLCRNSLVCVGSAEDPAKVSAQYGESINEGILSGLTGCALVGPCLISPTVFVNNALLDFL